MMTHATTAHTGQETLKGITMADIAGWYEGEEGPVDIIIDSADDVECLAGSLYMLYGEDCVGVDMELEGEYTDGSDVASTIIEILDELDYLTN